MKSTVRQTLKGCLSLFCLCAVSLLRGQDAKTLAKATERANDYVKAGAYAKAISIYEQTLKDHAPSEEVNFATKSGGSRSAFAPNTPKKLKAHKMSSRQVQTTRLRLANCYRQLNRPADAEPLFTQVFDDSLSSLTLRPDEYVNYGEVLLQLGRYDSAANILKQRLISEPDHEKTLLLLRSCEVARHIKPFFSNIEIKEFPFNTKGDDNAPFLLEGSLVFTSDGRNSGGFFADMFSSKSGATGRSFLQIYQAKPNEKTENGFEKPKKLSRRLFEIGRNTANASFTADGSLVFFAQNDVNDDNTGSFRMQIYCAERKGDAYSNIRKMPFCYSTRNYFHPAISPDGKHLYFVAEREDGVGGTDIWVSHLSEKGTWSKAENLGNIINTVANEAFPFVASDGSLYFCSKGHAGFGGFDIFKTKWEDGKWATPINLGMPINSPSDDISFCIDATNKRGAFATTKGRNGDDIILFELK